MPDWLAFILAVAVAFFGVLIFGWARCDRHR